jgi:hypothetical protein
VLRTLPVLVSNNEKLTWQPSAASGGWLQPSEPLELAALLTKPAMTEL